MTTRIKSLGILLYIESYYFVYVFPEATIFHRFEIANVCKCYLVIVRVKPEKKRNMTKMGEPPRCKWLKHTQMVIEYGISKDLIGG